MANYNLGSVQGSIDIDYDGRGVTEARADIRRAARELEREKLVAKIEADTKVLQRKRDEALAMLETLVSRTWTPEVQLEIDDARAQLAGFESQLARIDGQRINITLDIAEELDRANAAMSQTEGRTQSLRKTMSDFGSDVRNTRDGIESFGNALSALSNPLSVAAGVHLLSSGVANLAVALAPAAGALAVMPALGLAAGSAFAVTKIATQGMGDAFSAVAEGDAEKLAEAMQKLPPEAQAVVKEYQRLKPALDSIKLDVQSAFWREQDGVLRNFAAATLPTVRNGFVNIAEEMGNMLAQSVTVLGAAENVSYLNTIFQGTEDLLRELGSAPGDFIAGIIAIGAAGSQYLGPMGENLAQMAVSFRLWTQSAQGQQQVTEWIRQGWAALVDLYYIIINIAGAVGGVFRPLIGDTETLLPTIRQLVTEMQNWVNSAEGQEQIAAIWQVLSAVSGALLNVITTLAPVIASIAMWFTTLPEPVQQVIAQFLAWATVIGLVVAKTAPLIAFFVQVGPLIARLGPVLMGLVNGFMAVMRVFRALSLLMMTNPWLLLIAAVIALVVIIVTNWDTIVSYLTTAWNWIVSLAQTVWGGIVTFFTTIWNAILTIATTVWAAIVAFFVGIWNAISAPVIAVWNGIVAFLTAVWEVIFNILRYAAAILLAIFFTIWNPLSELVMTVWNAIVAFLTMVWNGIVTLATTVWNAVSAAIMFVWNAIVAFLMPIIQAISDAISTAWNFIAGVAETVWNAILNTITSVWNAIWGFIGPILETIGSAISAAWDAIMSVINTVNNAIFSVISSVWNSISSFFSGIWNTISGIFQGAVGRVMGILGDLWNSIRNLAGSALNILVDAGRNIVQGLWNGIQSMGAWLRNTIMGWIRNVVPGPVLEFLGIASPSRYMRDEVGKHIPTGIAEGIEATSGVAAKAAGDLAKGTGEAAKIAAAQEMMAALDGGVEFFEDFSFRGMSKNASALNDVIADAFYANGRDFNPNDPTMNDQIKQFLAQYIKTQQVSAAVGALPASAQSQIGNLAVSAGTSSSGITPAQSASNTAAAATAVPSSGNIINIGTLALSVEGNLDPTDPVRWRKAMEAIREGITNVEASYR